MLTVANEFQGGIVLFVNRVLSDYPAAKKQLATAAGKVVLVRVGALSMRLTFTGDGKLAPVGDSTLDADIDLTISIPIAALPGLAAKTAHAFNQIKFDGDSELAATLSDIARNVEWDSEADLARWVGVVAAQRIAGGAKGARAWGKDAAARLAANMAEYLVEEKHAFVSRRTLETFTQENEQLRDDLARLAARLDKLASTRAA